MRKLCLTLAAYTAILAAAAYYRPALMNEANLLIVSVCWAIAALSLHALRGRPE